MDANARDTGALRLAEAARARVPTAPLTAEFGDLDVETAYAIQLANVEARLAAGATVRGHKVGLTSAAMQEMLGVGEPDYGHLLDDMFYDDGAVVPAARFLQPRVEIEIAFWLGSRLRGPGVTPEDVVAATESVAPAIEIIDSRIADWKITLADTIADNASSAGVVLGPWSDLRSGLDLAAVTGKLVVNGSVRAEGSGRDVLGHPASAVAWLVNKLADLGREVRAGHVVMPGSCTKAVDVGAGDHVDALFEGLGSVGVTFSIATDDPGAAA